MLQKSWLNGLRKNLTEKIYDGDFPSMVYYGVVNDQKALEVLFHFREALDKMWKELDKSDVKAPKARMKEYFGVDKLEIEINAE